MILCLTNSVAAEITANAILAVGERPLMCNSVEEIDELMGMANALLVNIGTVDEHQFELMKRAAALAKKNGVPWVLDPVGVQVSAYRRRKVSELLDIALPTVIKGNAEEMEVLLDDERCAKSVLVTTGKNDIIRLGEKQEMTYSGSKIMTRVTGMGCALGGVIAAKMSPKETVYETTKLALNLFKLAATSTEYKCEDEVGSFKMIFLDELNRFSQIILSE